MIKTIKTQDELRAALSPEIIDAGKTVFTAMAYVEMIKPTVRKYQQEILDRHQFKMSEKMSERHGGEIIKKESETYMMRDDHFQIYLAELRKAHKAHGFDVPKDHCPLLIAEDLERKATWALFDLMEPITGIGRDNLFKLEHIRRYKDLTLRMLATRIKEND